MVQLPKQESNQFDHLVDYVVKIGEVLGASASAVFVIHRDRIVTERYFGRHSHQPEARTVQADSRFNVASVRKSYLGLAIALAIHDGNIHGIDDAVADYFPELDPNVLDGTTLRHLLTHTHGLGTDEEGKLYRRFAPGTNWEYRGENNVLLTKLYEKVTGTTVADTMRRRVFAPLQMNETEWQTEPQEDMVMVIEDAAKPAVHKLGTNRNGGENQINLYVSARELAYWGYLNLKRGKIGEKQIVPAVAVEMSTSLHSPSMENKDLPQNGFYWFVKELPAKRTEIGDNVPAGSFQMLGYSGAVVLVVPQHELVAVRMYNRWGSPQGYDYLQDIRTFGDEVMKGVAHGIPLQR
ncbi:MAG: serine hydrolase domain-containing protein [Clostridia bacterium]